MGCDGGTIPKRDELVKTKKKKETTAREITHAAKWNHCHLSQQPLEKPIVADLLGFLYKKECLIEYLLDKSKYEKGPEHVKSLKDVKELDLTLNPSYDANRQESSDEFSAMNKAKWICSLTGLEMNGAFKFYYLFNCGCVFSERAYKKIQTKKCIKCDKEYNENDLIVINANDEDLEQNKHKLKLRKEAQAKAKLEKTKNSEAKASASGNVKVESTDSAASSSSSKNESKKRSIDLVSTTAKVHPVDSSKKAKSIQEDPNASEVYKSLFTTSSKAKNQQKAHWVTFNPQYF